MLEDARHNVPRGHALFLRELSTVVEARTHRKKYYSFFSRYTYASCKFILYLVHIIKKNIKDVSRKFDEFRVNTHLCKLRCWYL